MNECKLAMLDYFGYKLNVESRYWFKADQFISVEFCDDVSNIELFDMLHEQITYAESIR